MRLSLIAGILALAAPLAPAQTSTWTSDPNHSEVDFAIRHFGVSNVHGRFGKVNAALVYDEADVTKSTVKATIDVTTVNTGVAARDTDLASDKYFEVAKFPSATFTSTGVVKDGNKLTVSGNLTVHGVTKPVILDVEGPSTPVEGMKDHKAHSGFTAATTISRKAFGIGSGIPTVMIGDQVKLTIELEIVKQ